MGGLAEAIERLDRAVARLEAALDARVGDAPASAGGDRQRQVAVDIATHLDAALARISQALGREE